MLIAGPPRSGFGAAAQALELEEQVVVEQKGDAHKGGTDPEHVQQGHADDAQQAEFRAALDADNAQHEGEQTQIAAPLQRWADHALVQDVPVGVAEDEHRAAEQRGQRAEQTAVNAVELDADDGDDQIDGHLGQGVPAGLLEGTLVLDDLVVDALAAFQHGFEGEEQQQEGVDVVRVVDAMGVDADDRQQEGRRHRVAEGVKGKVHRLAQVEQAEEALAVGVEELAHPERDAVDDKVHHKDDLDEEHVVDAVDADELEIAEVGQQHHVRVVEDDAGQLVQQHRVLLGDGRVIRLGLVVDPGVVLVGVPQDDRNGQHGAQAVQKLHGQDVLGEHQHQHLADAGDQGGGGFQVAEHVAAAVHIHQQLILALHEKAGDGGQAVQDGVQQHDAARQGEGHHHGVYDADDQHDDSIQRSGAAVIVVGSG